MSLWKSKWAKRLERCREGHVPNSSITSNYSSSNSVDYLVISGCAMRKWQALVEPVDPPQHDAEASGGGAIRRIGWRTAREQQALIEPADADEHQAEPDERKCAVDALHAGEVVQEDL